MITKQHLQLASLSLCLALLFNEACGQTYRNSNELLSSQLAPVTEAQQVHAFLLADLKPVNPQGEVADFMAPLLEPVDTQEAVNAFLATMLEPAR